MAAFEAWQTEPPALKGCFRAGPMTKAIESLDYFVLGGVLRIHAGDMAVQIQLGSTNWIHFRRPTTALLRAQCFLGQFCLCELLLAFTLSWPRLQHLAFTEISSVGWKKLVITCLSYFCPKKTLNFYLLLLKKSSLCNSTVICFLIGG